MHDSINEAASILQRRLMEQQPEVEFARWAVRMKPAEKLSGDIVLTWSEDEGKDLNCFIGDVIGHGASAAFVSLVVASTLLRHRSASVSKQLETLNQLLQMDDADLLFCTGLLMTLSNTGLLTIGSAGHPLGHLIDAHGHVKMVPTQWGPPMGLFDELVNLEIEQIQLNPGDRILLLTDGLLERAASKKSKNLPNSVSANLLRAANSGNLQTDADMLWILLRGLAGRSGPPDDQTMILLEYTGPTS